MTCFASRSSGFVLFAPRDPPLLSLSSSRPWRDEHIRSRAELPRRGAKGRTTLCLRARAGVCHHSCVRVYSCLHMHMHARACMYIHRVDSMQECGSSCGCLRGMYRRMLRQRMRNEVRAFRFSHRVARNRGRVGRVFPLAVRVYGTVHERGMKLLSSRGFLTSSDNNRF